jgi:hypothetical protein
MIPTPPPTSEIWKKPPDTRAFVINVSVWHSDGISSILQVIAGVDR